MHLFKRECVWKLIVLVPQDPRSLVWEDLKLRGVSDDYDHTPLSERSRKEGKGFRNSFKKLFKKKWVNKRRHTTTLHTQNVLTFKAVILCVCVCVCVSGLVVI